MGLNVRILTNVALGRLKFEQDGYWQLNPRQNYSRLGLLTEDCKLSSLIGGHIDRLPLDPVDSQALVNSTA